MVDVASGACTGLVARPNVLIGCIWFGEWADAVEACFQWSREHGHRHRIEWNAVSGGWRITCVLPAPGDDREANHA